MRNTPLIAIVAGLLVAGLAPADPDRTGRTEPPRIGEPAPNVDLSDLDGNGFELASAKGRIVILEWFNAGCPYSRGVYERGTVRRTLDAIGAADASGPVYVAVNSTGDLDRADIVAQSRAVLAGADLADEVRVLLDEDGACARAFGARTTPHVFVIDAEGVLRYAGAYTNDPRGKEPDAINYVTQVVAQLKAGEAVSPERTDPWGCRVRLKE